VIVLVFIWQGVPQNLAPYVHATTLEGAKQTIAQGPVASQGVIKVLGTNGSSFAGLSTNTSFYNLTLAAAMLMGRFVYAIPLLAVAGSLAEKKRVPPSAGAVPTHSLQFVGLLVGVVVIWGGLEYFPAIALGPATEQASMSRGIHYPAP
jgi:K+-transporting ATPase A subunit